MLSYIARLWLSWSVADRVWGAVFDFRWLAVALLAVSEAGFIRGAKLLAPDLDPQFAEGLGGWRAWLLFLMQFLPERRGKGSAMASIFASARSSMA